MANRPLPDPALLHKLLEYDPVTGLFRWRSRTPDMFDNSKGDAAWRCKVWNSKNAGNEAFRCRHGKGSHYCGVIFGEVWLAHRVAWAMHYGVSEFDVIDHIDGNGLNNRVTNLRTANRAINARNAAKRHDNTSGTQGVHWHVGRWGRARWVARIQIGGRRKFLGSFDNFEDAVACREAAMKAHGFGPAHGRTKERK